MSGSDATMEDSRDKYPVDATNGAYGIPRSRNKASKSISCQVPAGNSSASLNPAAIASTIGPTLLHGFTRAMRFNLARKNSIEAEHPTSTIDPTVIPWQDFQSARHRPIALPPARFIDSVPIFGTIYSRGISSFEIHSDIALFRNVSSLSVTLHSVYRISRHDGSPIEHQRQPGTSLQRALVKYQTKLCFSASSVLLKEIITSAATEFDLHTETSLLVS